MEIDPSQLLTRAERYAFNEEIHYLGKPCKRGHVNKRGQTWRARNGYACVLCKREIALQWAKDNPARAAASTARRDSLRIRPERKKQTPFSEHAGGIRARCRLKRIPVEIGGDDLKILWRKQNGKCFWTGEPLDFQIGEARHPLRPSVDRLSPDLGYVGGNIVWATNFANRAKGNCPPEEFAQIMRRYGFKGLFEVGYP